MGTTIHPIQRNVIDVRDEQRELDSIIAGFVERIHHSLPPGDNECESLFAQWREGFEMALRHPGNQNATNYADALLENLVSLLKERGVNTLCQP